VTFLNVVKIVVANNAVMTTQMLRIQKSDKL
jgi:hypothetical protein